MNEKAQGQTGSKLANSVRQAKINQGEQAKPATASAPRKAAPAARKKQEEAPPAPFVSRRVWPD